jgi:dTMP kinase
MPIPLDRINPKIMLAKKKALRFISFEGGEGAGKTSLMNSVAAALREKEVSLITTREPGGTAFGEQLRQWILNHDSSLQYGSKAELLLFLAARAQHIQEKIAPAIQEGVLVLCDRFNDSTIAYQGVGRHLGVEWVSTLCALICQGVTPDLTFYLDLDPEEGMLRRRKISKENSLLGQLDRIESEALQFHQRIRHAFQAIAQKEPERLHLIDASQPLEAVFETAMQIISKRL